MITGERQILPRTSQMLPKSRQLVTGEQFNYMILRELIDDLRGTRRF